MSAYGNPAGAPAHGAQAQSYQTDQLRHYNASGQVTSMPAQTAAQPANSYDYYASSSRGGSSSSAAVSGGGGGGPSYYGSGYPPSSGGYRSHSDHHVHSAYDSSRHDHHSYGQRPSAYSQSGYTDASYGRSGGGGGYGSSHSHYGSGGGQRMSAYAAAGYGKPSSYGSSASAYGSHAQHSHSHHHHPSSMHSGYNAAGIGVSNSGGGHYHSASHRGATAIGGGAVSAGRGQMLGDGSIGGVASAAAVAAASAGRYTRTDPLAKRPIIGVSETNLYIRGIPTMWREEEVRAYFEQFGPISSVNVWIDKITGDSKGTGFVDFQRPADATQVISQLDQSYVRLENGESWKYPLQIKFADLRDNRKERSRRDPSVQVTGLAAKRAQFASHRMGAANAAAAAAAAVVAASNGVGIGVGNGGLGSTPANSSAAAMAAGLGGSSVYGRSQYAAPVPTASSSSTVTQSTTTSATTTTSTTDHGSAGISGAAAIVGNGSANNNGYPNTGYDRGRRGLQGGGTHVSSLVSGQSDQRRGRGYSRSRSRERRGGKAGVSAQDPAEYAQSYPVDPASAAAAAAVTAAAASSVSDPTDQVVVESKLNQHQQ